MSAMSRPGEYKHFVFLSSVLMRLFSELSVIGDLKNVLLLKNLILMLSCLLQSGFVNLPLH